MNQDYDLSNIRITFSYFVKEINNHRRRSLLPYDWNEAAQKDLVSLCKLLKVNMEGKILKKDKRGSWR